MTPPLPKPILRDDTEHGRKYCTMAEAVAYGKACAAAERERICAAIQAEDDHCANFDYMLDSKDCISVARGEWVAPVAWQKTK